MLSPIDGAVRYSVESPNGPAVGLHLFPTSSGFNLFSCTREGHATLSSFIVRDPQDSYSPYESSRVVLDDAEGGAYREVMFCKVDQWNNRALYGGKGVPINVWDLQHQKQTWRALPTSDWFTSAAFQREHKKQQLVAGTSDHQVHLYDVSAQRTPVRSFSYKEASIKALTEDPDGYTIYVGNAVGDLGFIDLRTGRPMDFAGKCFGSITSIARHSCLRAIGVCGFDNYFRLWDTSSRSLIQAALLDNHLTCTLFDAEFVAESVEVADPVLPSGPLSEKSSSPTEKRKRLPPLEGRRRKKKNMLMVHRLRTRYMWSQGKSKSQRRRKKT